MIEQRSTPTSSQTDPVGLVARIAHAFEEGRGLDLREALSWIPYSTGFAAASCIGIAWVARLRHPTFPYFETVAALGVSAFLIAVPVAALVQWRLARTTVRGHTGAAVSWVLAAQLGVVLLIVPAVLLSVGVAEDRIRGWLFPVLNKRWLVGLYNLAVATFVLFPAAIERWRRDPRAADDHAPSASLTPPAARPARRWARAGGMLVAVLLSWYFAGPPWNLHRLHREIDWHEQLHLGPLQAISKGYLPYIGPASIVYGPGAQILTYEVMTRSRAFDIVGFRTAGAAFNFAAMVVVAILGVWWFGLVGGAAVVLLALTYSPLAFYYTMWDGTYAGFYGWANPLRYLAPLIVVPALGHLALDAPRPWQNGALVLLGALWGIGAWIAQENLSTTAVASGFLLCLLWCTRNISISRAVRMLSFLIAGLACVVIPILVYYGFHGLAGEFVRNYFLNPRAVAMGFSNSWWPAQNANLPERYSYYFTFPFLLILILATLWRIGPLQLRTPLVSRQVLLLSFLCVQVICYQTALFRSDSTHVRNTLIALPFILVLAFWDLPKWLADARWRRATLRAIVVLLAVAVYPTLRLQAWTSTVTLPMIRFKAEPAPAAPGPVDERSGFKRATTLLSDEPIVAADSQLSMRTFLQFASDLHALVGRRKTYVANVGNVYTGLVYFMADLTPAPYPLDLETMTINGRWRSLVLDHMRAHPGDYECFIGPSLDQPEARIFLEGHPGAVTIQRDMGPVKLYIILADG